MAMKIVEVNREVKKLVDENNGYCPCTIVKNEDTKCMCKQFKEQTTPGLCHCGRFEKVLTMKKINWNSIVKVKLTDDGKEIFRAQYDDLNAMQVAKGCMTYKRPEPYIDENGYTPMKLWSFMQLYGDHIGMALPLVTDGPYFYIDDAELEEVTING